VFLSLQPRCNRLLHRGPLSLPLSCLVPGPLINPFLLHTLPHAAHLVERMRISQETRSESPFARPVLSLQDQTSALGGLVPHLYWHPHGPARLFLLVR
jgi:hypothetical protein